MCCVGLCEFPKCVCYVCELLWGRVCVCGGVVHLFVVVLLAFVCVCDALACVRLCVMCCAALCVVCLRVCARSYACGCACCS